MGDESDPAISVHGLVSRFDHNIVHDDLSLRVGKGEVFGLIGGSGAGKSVLLDTLIGLKAPDAGRVEVLGVDLRSARPSARRSVERRWGVLFQSGALFSALSVRDNVAAPLREHTRLGRRTIDEIADMKLALAGLPAGVGELRPAELSGGMRKRVGLARAIALDPELLFLDEPTAGLDAISAEALDLLIGKLSHALGLTVFLITHDLDSLYSICSRVGVIADKKLIAAAPINELEQSDHPWIRDYLLGPRGRAAGKAATTRARAVLAYPGEA